MHIISTLLTTSCIATALALPVTEGGEPDAKKLIARLGRNDGGDHLNAIDIHLDATGWTEIANQDAYAMLCKGGPRVLQRVTGEDATARKKRKSAHYRDSGAAAQPFKGDGPHKYNLSVPNLADGELPKESAEEFPFESSNVVGESSTNPHRLVYLFPGSTKDQAEQGRHLTSSFDKYDVGFGSWYHIVAIDNCPLKWCLDFNKNDGRDCEQEQKDSKDPSNVIAVRLSNPGQKYAFGNLKPHKALKLRAKEMEAVHVLDGEEFNQDFEDTEVNVLDASDEEGVIENRAAGDRPKLTRDEDTPKLTLSDATPDSEIVLDNLPAISHD